MSERDKERVLLGRVSGVFGVQGWVKIFSYTEPRDNILNYSSWQIGQHGKWRPANIIASRRSGKHIISQIEGYDSPEKARLLMGAEIAISPQQLKKPAAGEYYWRDLIGLAVINQQGITLGTVASLFETGANDVIVVKDDQGTEHLIPYIKDQVVIAINLAEGWLKVDWDEDF